MSSVFYTPTNPGWGAAATFAKNKKLQQEAAAAAAAAAAPQAPAATAPTGDRNVGDESFSGTGHPLYRQLESLLNAQGSAERSGAKSAIQQMLISFGAVPDSFQDKFGVLDATTKDLIQRNTDTGISHFARLREQRADQIRDTINRLSARGLRRSGARGYQLRRNQLSYDRNFADGVSSLLGQISGIYNNLTGNDFQRQVALANMLTQLYQQYFVPSSSAAAQQTSSSSPTFLSPGGSYGSRSTDFFYNNFDRGYRGDLLF